MEDILLDEDYEVIVACNGLEALEKVKTEHPALILMDMKMPGLDGIETLKELKAAGLAGHVIMMTAYGELEMVEQVQALGAHAYITKPFDIVTLCNMVASYLKGHQEEN